MTFFFSMVYLTVPEFVRVLNEKSPMKRLIPILLFLLAAALLPADDAPSVTLHHTGEFGRFFREYQVPGGTFFFVVKSAPFQIKDLLEKDMLRLAITPEPPKDNPKWKVTKLAIAAPVLAVHPDNPLRDISAADASALLQQKFGSWRTFGGPITRIHLYRKMDNALPPPVIQTCGCRGEQCHDDRHDHGEKTNPKKQFFSYGKPLLFQTENDNKAFSLLFTDPLGLACFDITRYDENRVPLLTIDKIPPTLKEFDSGRYPLLKTYYLVEPANPTPAEKQLVKYIFSRGFARQLYEAGFLPARVASSEKPAPATSPMRKPVSPPSPISGKPITAPAIPPVRHP